jgi:hypothetical protein
VNQIDARLQVAADGVTWAVDASCQGRPQLLALGSTRSDEDDELLDAWLASLSVPELERFLSRLADLEGGASSAIDRTTASA